MRVMLNPAAVRAFLVPGALAGMNDEARGITLALVETGCFPKEICDVTPEDLSLDDGCSFIYIRNELFAPRRRRIPLVGVAHAVFTRNPAGFPRYRGNTRSYCAHASRCLRENGLLSRGQSIVGLRGAMHERLLMNKVGGPVREAILGYRHEGGWDELALEVPLCERREALRAIAYDFDPSIV
ncbi:hypothetical protein [Aliihoeflea sp. 2WW]|uniref:hypothetical protein n=1 Tax=Aliihoeflea sp. 2WW TaxID=1381123 RepID=UPI000467CFFF|nr:hypothetical protein [Aliihoeflea sp. 2WW]